MTPSERQAEHNRRYRAKQRGLGMILVQVTIPAAYREALLDWARMARNRVLAEEDRDAQARAQTPDGQATDAEPE